MAPVALAQEGDVQRFLVHSFGIDPRKALILLGARSSLLGRCQLRSYSQH
jgi:hypothetical protein